MSIILGFLKKQMLLILLALAWLALFQAGLQNYAGSKLLYVVFSLVSLAGLMSAMYWQVSFGYLFFSVFLWLGFWFKLSTNFLLFGYFPFGEPVGAFDGSPLAWDTVLGLATVASFAALCGRVLCAGFKFKVYQELTWTRAPAWYSSIRKWLWIFVIALIIGATIFNVIYGVHQIGIAPRNVFPWPSNALLAWFLNSGAALIVTVLIAWDLSLNKKIEWSFGAVLMEGFLTTVSIISRSTFLFHVLPQALAMFQRQEVAKQLTKKKICLLGVVFFVLFASSIAMVSILRDFQYGASKALPMPGPATAAPKDVKDLKLPAAEPAKVVSSFRLILIHQLAVNRWIGIEGAMAVSAYAGKSESLLWHMLLEKRELGRVTAYQGVSNSGYQVADAKYEFASMPGMPGFLYFSGSLWVVFAGMAMVVVFTVLSERAIFRITRNPILCSLYGMLLANTFAQFGVTPRQDVPQFLMFYVAVLALGTVGALSSTQVQEIDAQ